jgi:two-component sensor histidine kinase
LIASLYRAYGEPPRISWKVKADRLPLGVDRAIPAGLILNELISNSLKHAFPDGRSGSILIEGSKEGDLIRLSVADDGVGVADTVNPRKPKSLGLEIVNILCRQLKGALEMVCGRGTMFRVSFPEN